MGILWVFTVEAGMRRRELRGDQGKSVPRGCHSGKGSRQAQRKTSAGSRATSRSEGFVLLFLQCQDLGERLGLLYLPSDLCPLRAPLCSPHCGGT